MSVRMIADICSNHNQSLERTRKLIEAAKAAGCQTVKAQLFDDRLHDDPTVKERLRAQQLPPEFVPEIARICKGEGIEFHCTPFSLPAVDVLAPHVDAFKIGSYEILWLALIRECAATGKPLGISTGGATLTEVQAAWRAAQTDGDSSTSGEQTTLYHCVPKYPTPLEEANIEAVRELGRNFPLTNIGYSDHTGSITAICAAVALGATSIEFHLDLNDLQGNESHLGHCWSTANVMVMIERAKETELAMREDRNRNERREKVWDMRSQRTDPRTGSRPIKEYL